MGVIPKVRPLFEIVCTIVPSPTYLVQTGVPRDTPARACFPFLIAGITGPLK
jgi:hypothetical protein